MLVGFGQTICKPIGPKCWRCGIKDLCPMKGKSKEPASVSRAASKRKAVETQEIEVEEEETKEPEELVVKTRKATIKRVKK